MNQIPRRTFLRGVGTMVALPLFEAMLPVRALASVAKPAPVRLAFLFVPNGVSMPKWTPATEGANYELTYLLQPLAKVRSEISIYTGLAQHNAFALQDGPGDHARSAAAWLTGVHPRKTSGADIHNGISADQLAAQHIGTETRFPSLELGAERGGMAGDCDSGYSCAYSSGIAWQSPTTPVAKETSPRAVFERLFGGDDPNESAEARAKRILYKQSILDMVFSDASALKSKLGMHDRQKLDEYLTAVREMEMRVAKYESARRAAKLAGVKEPADPRTFGEEIRLMGDMLVLAFQTDQTRVATFMFANEGSNRSYPEAGVPEGHHDMSHHGADAHKLDQKGKIDLFHTTQLAYILEKMASIKEAGGTLLDNTALIYGGGISDGDRHNHDDLPILLAGRAGGRIKQGRHVTYPAETPMNNLLLSVLDAAGVHAEKLGDSTGRLQQLF
ncbi:MAG TPA: DUF1552 domain-containing protein [Fimbriimonadaceae bacterium]|nr:DUF1552 domain-containing protein [Fimbriimonadaceae bacterium]